MAGRATSDDARLRERLADDLERWRVEHGVPGAALAVVGPDDRRTIIVSGVADVRTGDSLRSDHRHQIGSISKVVTALTVLRAAETGAVRLDDPVVRHVPWFRAGPDTRDITLHHLLSHQAGLPIGPDWSDASAYDVWALRDLDVLPPGERYWYSNVGYKTLAVVLSSVLGRPLADVQERDVLRPLGLAEAVARVGVTDLARDAIGHEPEPDRYPRSRAARVRAPEVPGTMGDGNVLASTEDAATLASGLLRLHAGTSTVVGPASGAALFGRHVRTGRGHWYGYGLGIDTTEGRRRFGHGGDMPGFRCSLIADPDAGVAVVCLSNLRGAPTRDLAIHALDAATRRGPGPHPPFDPRPRVDPQVAGRYRDDRGTADLRVVGGESSLTLDGTWYPLRALDPTTFEVLDPNAGRHRLAHVSSTGRHGPALAYGSRLLGRDGPRPATVPAGGAAALVGTYRSSDPWSRRVEVLAREGHIYLVEDDGSEGRLVRVGHDRYRIGQERNPERAVADAWADGHPLRLTVSGRPLVRDA